MLSSALVLAIGAAAVGAVTGQLGDAPISQNNPFGATWQAVLPQSNSTTVRGYVSGTSNVNGTGVVWSVNLQGLPAAQGPYHYHVHQFPVPSDGNCTGTGPHLDPQIRGEAPPCDPTQPETCQVGDLTGKHGAVTSDPWQVFYLDLYTSAVTGSPAYIGNRSIVVHNGALARITCANLTAVQAQVAAGSSCSSSAGSSASGTLPPSPVAGNSTIVSPTPPSPVSSKPATTSIVIPSAATNGGSTKRAGGVVVAALIGALLLATML